MKEASDSTIVGVAGEHYVMFQLLRRNFIAALAPKGVPNVDIVLTDTIGERTCAIQVKTRRNLSSDGGWPMGKKHENLRSPTLFYAFVEIDNSPADAVKCWVVPSSVVADVLSQSHATWLGMPGRKGRSRSDNNFRRLLPDYTRVHQDIGYGPGWLDPYRENWAALKAASDI